MYKLFFAIILISSLCFVTCDNVEFDLDQLAYCENNSDCMIVKKDCCGCSAGGENFSINKEYQEYWMKNLAEKCKDTVCATVYVCPESMTPVCTNNQCDIISD